MASKTNLLVGLTAIAGGIRELRGVISNVYDRAQLIGVSIINHDLNGGKDGEPSNDCSKAKDLVNVLKTQEDKRNMVAWLAFFGNIGVKMENGVATDVSHFKPDNRRYRAADLDGAKVNNWYEPYEANGDKKHWFEGPAKALYTPGTIGALGDNIINFADRFLGTERRTGQLYDKIDNGAGTMVPRYNLTNNERDQIEKVLRGMKNIGYMLGAREESEELTARVVELEEYIKEAGTVVETLDALGSKTVAA